MSKLNVRPIFRKAMIAYKVNGKMQVDTDKLVFAPGNVNCGNKHLWELNMFHSYLEIV